jgi:biotin carboxyl carrier protein
MGPPIKIIVKGQPVFLCCKDCATDAQENPHQTLAKVDSLKTLLKKQHDVKGKIVRLTVTIEHEDIPDILKQGRMEFSVEGVKGLESLKAGDLIQGKLKLKDGDYHITELSPSKTGQRPLSRGATLAGVVEVDETRLARIHARFKGRIDKLHVKVTGQSVKKGEPLADLSSPDLTVTTQNLLDAYQKGAAAKGLSATDSDNLVRVLHDRLRQWGIDDAQIYRIILSGMPMSQMTIHSPISGHVLRKHQVEGNYVEEGAALFDVADLSTVWIEAAIKDEADMAFLKKMLPVRVTTNAFPKREFSGQVLGLFQDEKDRTLKVRFTVKNPRDELLPGMLVHVMLGLPAAPQAGPSDKKDTKLKALLKERLATLRALTEATTKDYQAGRVSFDRVHQAMQALLHAELELCESDRERITVLEKMVNQAKTYEEHAVQRYKAGAVTQSDVLMARAGRLEAEIALERAKAKALATPK